MKKMLAALAVAAALIPLTSAQAASISFTETKLTTTTNWFDTLSFGKFDSSLGTLKSIKFDLTGLVQGTASAESLDAMGSTVTLSLASLLTLFRPDNSTLVVTNPLVSEQFGFTEFDGLLDFGGTSGGTTGTITNTQSSSFTSTAASDLALFSALGGGFIDLGLGAVGNSSGTGSGNLITQFNTAASGTVVVTYDYTPFAVPEPATMATLLTGLGLIGVARRRASKKA